MNTDRKEKSPICVHPCSSVAPFLYSLHVKQLHLEGQLRVGRDLAHGAVAVGQVRRDDQLALAANLHAGHALVPALDDLAATEPEREGLAAVEAAVELRTVLQRAGVMDDDLVALLGRLAVADLQ